MTDESDWDNERYERSTQRLRDTNAGLVREIESLGSGVDLTTARLEHFIAFLVDEGVLTEGQKVREQYRWEKGLRTQLIAMRDAAKERLKQLHELQRKQRRELAQRQAAEEKKEQAAAPSLILPPGAKK